MCNWKRWIWPGILTIVILTALANWFKGDAIEADLAAKANSALSKDHPWAEFSLDRRDLTLSGIAPTPADAQAALQLADDAYDVRIVVDNTSPMQLASPYKFGVTKNIDAIVLTGNAPNIQTREAILAAAQKAAGGMSVTDQLELAAGAPVGFGEMATKALSIMPLLETGEASLSDTNLEVSGASPSSNNFDMVNDSLSQLPDGYSLTQNAILPPPVSPYRWSVSKKADEITLRGNVVSEARREQVLAAVAEAMPGARITDTMALAGGSPDNMDAAQNLLIGLVSRMDAGQGNLVDQVVSIAGRAESEETVNRIVEDLNSGLPAGYNASTNIVVPETAEAESEPELPIADPYLWRITKSADGILLSGNVSDSEEAESIATEAKSKLGIGEISDEQKPARGAPSGIEEVRSLLIGQMRLFDESVGEVKGNVVTLSGKVKNSNLAGLIDRSMKKHLPTDFQFENKIEFPVSKVENARPVEVLPPIADPFRWSIAKQPEGVTILGNVTNESVGAKLVDAARAQLGASQIDNKQIVARGAPPEIDSVRELLISQLRLLESGQGNIIGKEVSITGNSRNQNIAGLVSRALKNRLPEGYFGSTNIVYPESEPEAAPEAPQITQEPEAEPEADTSEAATTCQQGVLDAISGRSIGFQSARATIKSASTAVLDDVVLAAGKCPNVRFLIAGHTDSQGRDSYNKELSRARALSVKKYLTDAGVDAARLEARGYGESQPIADNDTQEGRAQNRRIEFKVIQ